MYSQQYKDLRKEIETRDTDGRMTYKQRTILEQQIFKDLLGQEASCRKCKRTDNLTLEHIIPKDILKTFGVDVDREIIEGNYTITCRICNSFKGNRLDFSIPETKQILLKLIQNL
jgi:5-methylcytosine-specific restriction endonuclease McrA